MSLVAGALLVGGLAVVLGAAALLGRRRARPRLRSQRIELLPPRGLMDLGFAADVGDVIALEGRELWLEDAWLLREREPVAALYFASEATVALFPGPLGVQCLRLEAVELVLADTPPTTLELRGVQYGRERRRPVRVEPHGKGKPPFVDAHLSEYAAGGGAVLWLLASPGHQRAWVGQALGATALERWGPGAA